MQKDLECLLLHNESFATGGASAIQSILISSIASISGCDIYTVQRPHSASPGAARGTLAVQQERQFCSKLIDVQAVIMQGWDSQL
ncbi:hypothetical protein QQP08_011930 [Theobroma cacao]|nr:hypothetical protein QQP08_011930 [Theobroma cacao]